jgi:malate permease and related proteins
MVDWQSLATLYIPLIGWVGLGLLLGRILPSTVPTRLGKFLFWLGVPIGIIVFLRQSDLSFSVWLAPLVAWLAVLIGAGLAWMWIRLHHKLHWPRPNSQPVDINCPASQFNPPDNVRSRQLHWPQPLDRPSQGSFLLSTMVGNTGYLGYPVALTLVGPQYFGWAVLYDTLGSTLAAYGLGVGLAAYFGMGNRDMGDRQQGRDVLGALIKNPALWSFWLGLAGKAVPLPIAVEQGLRGLAWGIIALSLLLLGMRLSQLTAWHNLHQSSLSLTIKMLIVPLVGGYGLRLAGITGPPLLVLVLQMAMPPAFATLIIAEAYDLDRDLAVTTLATGSAAILLTLPLWLWLFGA